MTLAFTGNLLSLLTGIFLNHIFSIFPYLEKGLIKAYLLVLNGIFPTNMILSSLSLFCFIDSDGS